jgi:asparagine synthase (glutamine-hydrolysing)
MCGITGFIDVRKKSQEETLKNMVTSLRHRGPNDCGWSLHTTDHGQIGMGQGRLSIIDLSERGHQPMHYQHLTIVYNGEVYNYEEIKKQLREKGHHFTSGSDTEVILHAFDEWGPSCVDHFIGMFAFVIYDRHALKVYACRDRIGVKPFFYFYNGDLLIFGSELKALHAHPGFEKEINIRSLQCYFNFGYIPSPYCIFEKTHKLKPGHYLIYDLAKQKLNTHCYWESGTFYRQPKLNISFQEASEELEKLLLSAFNYRMVADVPVGVFLSGGYDSTAVAALLQKERTEQLKTFTIGFEEGNDESLYAAQTAAYLGTDHNEYICTTEEAQLIIPDLPYYFDEPFADSSAIPTLLVSRFARQQVTVALSADGGDEIFGGYNRYFTLLKYKDLLNNIPRFLRKSVSSLATVGSAMVPASLVHRKHHLESIGKVLAAKDVQADVLLYKQMHIVPSVYRNNLFSNKISTSYPTSIDDQSLQLDNVKDWMMLVDFNMYLPDDILAKVDRATMSTSLEGREPLLDHRLLEFAARLPIDYKIRQNKGKYILRDIVHRYVPKEMLDRPKTGFRIPLSSWLHGDLNYLLQENLRREIIERAGILNPQFISDRVREFNSHKLHYTPFIWKILMFQMWYERWMNKR